VFKQKVIFLYSLHLNKVKTCQAILGNYILKTLRCLNEIEKMDDTDKGHILSVVDGFIKSIKLKNIAAL